jgi:hypothetical protein
MVSLLIQWLYDFYGHLEQCVAQNESFLVCQTVPGFGLFKRAEFGIHSGFGSCMVSSTKTPFVINLNDTFESIGRNHRLWWRRRTTKTTLTTTAASLAYGAGPSGDHLLVP